MANSLARNPIYVDTAFSGSFKASVAAALGSLFTLRVSQVRWAAPGVVGHQAEFVDPQGGDQLLLMTCDAVGKDVVADWSAAPRLWADFNVPQLGSGKLFIYLV